MSGVPLCTLQQPLPPNVFRGTHPRGKQCCMTTITATLQQYHHHYHHYCHRHQLVLTLTPTSQDTETEKASKQRVTQVGRTSQQRQSARSGAGRASRQSTPSLRRHRRRPSRRPRPRRSRPRRTRARRTLRGISGTTRCCFNATPTLLGPRHPVSFHWAVVPLPFFRTPLQSTRSTRWPRQSELSYGPMNPPHRSTTRA